MPRWDEILVDGHAFVFAAAAALLAAGIIGVFPALRASRPDVSHMLREAASGIAGSPGQRRLHCLLIFVQTSLATVFLLGFALLIYSFGRLAWVDFGFDAA